MRQLKDVLRLKLEDHHSHQRIAQMLGLSKGAVTKYVKLAGAAGLSSWSQVQDMDETALHNHLLGAPVRSSDFVTPDYAKLHQELGRKGMTLMLLWQEHAEQHPGQAIHSYSQFCENYRRFAKKLKRSMRQVHRAGEKLFIDYAGPTVALADGSADAACCHVRDRNSKFMQPKRARESCRMASTAGNFAGEVSQRNFLVFRLRPPSTRKN